MENDQLMAKQMTTVTIDTFLYCNDLSLSFSKMIWGELYSL